MDKKVLKNIAIYAGIVLFFLVLSYTFVPEVLGGKIVNQSDISGWKGMAEETVQWNKANPDNRTAWSDSMFGGMPNVTFYDDFEGDLTNPLYKALLWGKRPASYLFIALLGAFLMMLAFGVNRFLAVAGAIAVAFCAYNFQIIQVGHNTKMQAIAFAPWAIAAVVFTYRQCMSDAHKSVLSRLLSVLGGSVLFGLALSFQIKANHVQITYYLAIVILIYALGMLLWVLMKENRHHFKNFALASAMLLVFGLVGIGTNANKLIPTYEYAQYTMRGGSELTKEGANSKGLELGYATAWSYGIEETPNLLIPNYNGGSSTGSLGEKSATYQLFKRAGQNARQICKSLPLYWGPQPFTAGPMYMGAISIFLFVLGLCLIRGREKWWLVVTVVLAVFLGWGSHFMWFTELWFNYAPMYNKFRTVSMALVILQFCLPILGICALDRILKDEYPHRDVVRATWISLGVTGGFCAVSALIPSLCGTFVSDADAQMQDVIVEALRQDRERLMQLDAWRSFLFILASAATIVWCYFNTDSFKSAKRVKIAAAIIGVLILADMWTVGKRYLNDSHFVSPKDFSAQFDMREADRYILEDEDPSYRVLDISESTFNSSVTSFRHKSIGGYSPAKMQRYQDLIDRYISNEINTFYEAASECTSLEQMQQAVGNMPVISMLNGRYIIVGADYPPLYNPDALGEAWFVESLLQVNSADEELAMLGNMDLESQAVVRMDRVDIERSEFSYDYDQCAIQMDSYAPNELHYLYYNQQPSVAVFSEIYHPSWKAYLKYQTPEGVLMEKDLDLFQVDWVLRGAMLPAGQGEIIMRYEPQDYATGKRISVICSILLLLTLLSLAAFYCWSSSRSESKCA